MSEALAEAIKTFEEKKLNKSVSLFKEILSNDPRNERALFYSCLIYRQLKKWGLCKRIALDYLKFHGKNEEILEVLGDVYYFEGDYLKSSKMYSTALKSASGGESKERIQDKLNKTKNKQESSKSQTKLALVVAEGSDSFTDDIVEGLSNYFWVRKFTVAKNRARFHSLLVKGLSRNLLNKSTYKLLVKLYPGILKRAMRWADIIWVEWASNEAVAASYLKNKSKRLFIRLHRYEAFEHYPFLIDWKNVDKVVFVSAFMKKVLEDRGIKINTEKSEVIYNGVDLQRFEFRPRDNGFDIGWVAHIIPRKNLHIALEIVRKLVDGDKRYKLHVAGDFPDLMYERYIKHLIKTMNLESNVVLYGWVDDIAKWWDDKNYLLSTSIHESFGYNITEAMARGIKPVIHNFDGAEELYEEEFLFNNIDEAVEKIRTGNYDSVYYREYIKNKKWTLENQIDEFKSLVEELAQRNAYLKYNA